MKMRKPLSLLLSALMIPALLVGCSKSNSQGTAEPSASPTQAAAASPSASVAPTPAEPTANLVWYVPWKKPSNYDSVIAKANELIKPKINATLELKWLEDMDTQMQMIMTSGEPYDITFTSSWLNKYYPAVAKGAYLALDDMLAKDPNFQKIMPQAFWDGAKVNGKLYAVPNLQLEYNQAGLAMNKALVDKYKIDVTKIKTAEDLTPIFQTIKDNEKDVIVLQDVAEFPGEGYSTTDLSPLSVDTKTWKVVSNNDIPANVANAKLRREWNKKGFYAPDVATLTDYDALKKAGKVFAFYSRPKPGNDAELKRNLGLDFVTIETGPMLFQSQAVLSTMTAISQSSKNPEKAFQLLSLVNTDKELYNTLVFGLENQDYKKVGDNRIEPIGKDAGGGYGYGNWVLGNVFNSYLIPGQADDVWQVTQANNEKAAVDPLSGFAVDRTKIASQVAAIDSVNALYEKILRFGLDDPDKTIAQYNAKLKAAGIETVIKEVQSQLDAWVAANKK